MVVGVPFKDWVVEAEIEILSKKENISLNAYVFPVLRNKRPEQRDTKLKKHCPK